MDQAQEITFLQSKMVNTVDHYTRQHQLPMSLLDDGSDDCFTEDRGETFLSEEKA